MTDRTDHLTVVLDRDMRENDVQHLMDAIRMMRFVVNVEINVSDPLNYTARARVLNDFRERAIHSVCLIFDNDSELTDLLARKKRERGY